jgi:subtilisin family serine protease
MPTSHRALLLALPAAVVLSVSATSAPPAAGASATAAATAIRDRLDPRLAAALPPGSPPVAVWVEFADKGETGPADLASRLAEAERTLTPESRRRRERAGVRPLVDWLDLPLEPTYLGALVARGHAVYGQSRWFNRVAVRTSGPALAALASLPFVRRVAPVELAEPREPQARPARSGALEDRSGSAPFAATGSTALSYGRSLGQLTRLGIPAVHDSGYIGTLVNVCVLDNGFNYYKKHEALKTIPVGALRARDFIRGGYIVQDTVDVPAYFEHGTATLSALGGRAPGRYLGAAPGCNAILGRTEDDGSEKPIEMVYWTMGAEWADSLGADIISSSLTYNLFPDSAGTDLTYPQLDGHTAIITRAAEIAAAKGILVVTSAGNDGNNRNVGRKVGAPADANGDSVIAIAAVDSFGVRAAFSSKGPTFDGRIKPDLAAQGVAVYVATAIGDPNTYEPLDGTSFSAPLVAGLAACLLQARPAWPPVWIIQAIKASASHASAPDTLTGWGIPNGLAALRYVPDTLGVPDPTSPLVLAFAGPNPLRAGAVATLRVSLGAAASPARYRVRVFDAAGREVRVLASGTVTPGSTLSIPWYGDDARGRTLVPGLYLLDLEGAGRRQSKRVIVLR